MAIAWNVVWWRTPAGVAPELTGVGHVGALAATAWGLGREAAHLDRLPSSSRLAWRLAAHLRRVTLAVVVLVAGPAILGGELEVFRLATTCTTIALWGALLGGVGSALRGRLVALLLVGWLLPSLAANHCWPGLPPAPFTGSASRAAWGELASLAGLTCAAWLVTARR